MNKSHGLGLLGAGAAIVILAVGTWGEARRPNTPVERQINPRIEGTDRGGDAEHAMSSVPGVTSRSDEGQGTDEPVAVNASLKSSLAADPFRAQELEAIWEEKYRGMSAGQLARVALEIKEHLDDASTNAGWELYKKGFGVPAALNAKGEASATASDTHLGGLVLGDNGQFYSVELNRENAPDLLELRDELRWVKKETLVRNRSEQSSGD